MNKHCGNCIKQDWCKANEGNGGNQDCADWQPKKLCPECGHPKHKKGECSAVVEPIIGLTCPCGNAPADLKPAEPQAEMMPLIENPYVNVYTPEGLLLCNKWDKAIKEQRDADMAWLPAHDQQVRKALLNEVELNIKGILIHKGSGVTARELFNEIIYCIRAMAEEK